MNNSNLKNNNKLLVPLSIDIIKDMAGVAALCAILAVLVLSFPDKNTPVYEGYGANCPAKGVYPC